MGVDKIFAKILEVLQKVFALLFGGPASTYGE